MANDQLFIGAVFVAGIFSFFSPCLVPLLPVYISMFAGDNINKDRFIRKIGILNINLVVIAKTLVFVLGISTSFIILGFGAGAFGSLINSKIFITLCGIVVIILGVHQTGLIHFSLLDRDKRLTLKSENGVLGTFLLGFSFSFGWTPCIGPLLATVLGLSATKGQVFYGTFLMFVYAMGLMIPFLIVAIFSDAILKHLKKLNKHLEKIKIGGGVIIIFMGILLMNNSLNLVTRIFEK